MDTIIECADGRKLPKYAKGTPCEYIKKNILYRCNKYIALAGKDPQSDKTIDEWRCVEQWIPILLVENARTNRGQTAAIESLRNEQIIGQQQFMQLIHEAKRLTSGE